MEERNALLQKNLDTLYGANLAAAVSMVLLLVPLINLIALLVTLFAAVMIFVAMYRLRNVHEDYHTAFMLSLINIPITLIGGMVGGGAESFFGSGQHRYQFWTNLLHHSSHQLPVGGGGLP